jgi:hypothetical protein
MANRIDDQNRSNQIIERAIQTRARETQRKESKAFQAKLMTEAQQGANAKQESVSRQILEQYGKGLNESPAEAASILQQATDKDKAGASQQLKQQKTQKDQKKEDTHKANLDKTAEKRQEKVALDTAVQRKKQQEDESGETGSGGGDFFQQAVTQGLRMQQATATAEPHPVQLPENNLQEIVDKVYMSMDPSGASQFIIELKSGVLNGGQIQVSSKGRNVQLRFSGLDSGSRRSVLNSQQQLQQRLQQKGLNLEKLDF